MSEHTKDDCITCPVCGVESAGSKYFSVKATMQAEITALKASNAELVEALDKTRKCLDVSNSVGLITDTLWVGRTETLFDYIDEALAKAKAYLAKGE